VSDYNKIIKEEVDEEEDIIEIKFSLSSEFEGDKPPMVGDLTKSAYSTSFQPATRCMYDDFEKRKIQNNSY
jgi:hypothetical protein